MQTPKHILAIVLAVSVIAPYHAVGSDPAAPYEQDFIITAYYSPLPDQCCYVKGGYEADKDLNGQGIAGADGTLVYPGMLAAPSSYAFGTRVALPGIGILSVHDRGGAIVELEDNKHRLDIWVGHGEEGLARALAFGVQRVRGTIYPLGSNPPVEDFALERLPSPLGRLEPYRIQEINLLALKPKREDRSTSVVVLQEHLRDLGYLAKEPTGYYGQETQDALAAFLKDFELNEPSDHLNEKAAAFLVAARYRKAVEIPIEGFVENGTHVDIIQDAQRILRFLGYYRGRTDGKYSDALFVAILSFQKKEGLVADETSPGAGRIGPITKARMDQRWNTKLVAKRAEKLLALHRIDQLVAKRGEKIDRFLGLGNNGAQVRLLQRLLARRGYFAEDKINGNFGPLTRDAVMAFQKDSSIITTVSDQGAGYVGPSTLALLKKLQRNELYQIVRSKGWEAL